MTLSKKPRHKQVRDPEKNRQHAATFRMKNRELCVARTAACHLKSRQKYRHVRRCRKKGLTTQQYAEMLLKQNGACFICEDVFDDTWSGKPRIDHDHDTGKARGLLCNQCNRAIGFLGDNPDMLEKAAKYLRDSKNVV